MSNGITLQLNGPIHIHCCEDEGQAALLKQLIADISQLKELVMATREELVAELNAIKTQISKVGDETRSLLTKVEELLVLLAGAGNTTPEIDAAVTGVKEQLQIVDDLVPDAPAG